MSVQTLVFRLPNDSTSALARAQIDLTGDDVQRFLQGLLSADVERIEPGTAEAAALLTVKGKIVTEVLVLCASDGRLFLSVPASQLQPTLELLDRYIIMDDVTPTAADPAAMACVWGPGGEALLQAHPQLRAFRTRHPVPGWLVIGEGQAFDALEQAATVATSDAFTAYRIETATPLWGHELTADRFPPEVGFVYAVNYEKGCYMGQEPLARIHARGQVNRVLVRVTAEQAPSGAPPVQLANAEQTDVGGLTSWVCVGEGAVTGLAIVRRKYAAPGTRLNAGSIEIEVCSGPLGDDRGVNNRHDQSTTVKLGKRSSAHS